MNQRQTSQILWVQSWPCLCFYQTLLLRNRTSTCTPSEPQELPAAEASTAILVPVLLNTRRHSIDTVEQMAVKEKVPGKEEYALPTTRHLSRGGGGKCLWHWKWKYNHEEIPLVRTSSFDQKTSRQFQKP